MKKLNQTKPNQTPAMNTHFPVFLRVWLLLISSHTQPLTKTSLSLLALMWVPDTWWPLKMPLKSVLVNFSPFLILTDMSSPWDDLNALQLCLQDPSPSPSSLCPAPPALSLLETGYWSEYFQFWICLTTTLTTYYVLLILSSMQINRTTNTWSYKRYT